MIMTASVSYTLGALVDKTGTALNTFVPDASIFEDMLFATVGVHKTVVSDGGTSIGPEGFGFKLKNTATGEEYVAVSNRLGEAEFTLGFTKDEIGQTYVYYLREINDGRIGVEYSNEIYAVEITVTADAANVVIIDAPTGRAEFQNVYHPGSVPVPPPTGDSDCPMLWMVLAFASMAGMTVLVRKAQKGGKA